MTRKLFCPLGCATLSLGFAFAPLADAVAGDIVIDNSTVTRSVYGNGNPVDGSAPTPSDPFNMATPDNNSVTIKNNGAVAGSSLFPAHVYGGIINSGPAFGAATGNSVLLESGGSVTMSVYGGRADSTTGGSLAAGNRVTISNGSAAFGTSDLVVGGYAASSANSATAEGNSVEIGKDSTVTGIVYGGHAAGAATTTAKDNSVTVTQGGLANSEIIAGFAAGAASGVSLATGNRVVITHDGGVAGNVYGGLAYYGADNTATNNSVTIDGGTVQGDVHVGRASGGADSGSAIASGNTLTIGSGGSVGGLVRVGDASGALATANDNTLTVSGGKVDWYVFGGDASSYGVDTPTTASGNTVTISKGGVVGGITGGYAVRSHSTGAVSAENNRVTIDNGTVQAGIYAGHAYSFSTTSNITVASGNSLSVSNGGIVDGPAYGGYALSLYNTTISTATANNNRVDIDGSIVYGDVYAGTSTSYGSNSTATASGNTLTINNGTVIGNVYAGHASCETYYGGACTATATDNTLTILGDTTFGLGTILYGGDVVVDTGTTISARNTLNLHAANRTVAGLRDFQNLNFYLPATLGNGGVMLNVSGTAAIDGSVVNVGIDGAHSPLRTGDHVVLIDAATLSGKPANLNETVSGQGMQGVSLLYEFGLVIPADNQNQLWAVVSKEAPRVNPQTEALSEGYLTGVGLLNQGGDLIAGAGMSAALNAARHPAGYGLGVFGTLTGGWSRYNTGSHAELASVSLMTGVSKRTELQPGNLTFGAFFEYGNGSYDTYNSFTNAASVHGAGDIIHLGGGIIGRMDFANLNTGHFYAEASARAGNIQNDWSSGDLRDAMGVAAQYDASSAYYGIHLAAGYLWNLTNAATLDLYTKYFWTHGDGETLRLSTGDLVAFEDVDSHRLRFGTRLNYAMNEIASPYAGLAWEHEFDGEARATVNGYSINAPSSEGGTGLGEIGLTLTAKDRPLLVDLGVQGYVGKREGISGMVHLRYDF